MQPHPDLPAKSLQIYGVTKDLDFSGIRNIKEFRSPLSALGPVLEFDHADKHYYLVDDYSLNDNPQLVKNILLDRNHLLKGTMLENPTPQLDGARYAAGIDGVEYYLWQSPLL